MTTGSTLYLLLSIGTFVAFALTLAFYSHQQSLQGREALLATDQHADQDADQHADQDAGVTA